jgi:hypothetical protein
MGIDEKKLVQTAGAAIAWILGPITGAVIFLFVAAGASLPSIQAQTARFLTLPFLGGASKYSISCDFACHQNGSGGLTARGGGDDYQMPIGTPVLAAAAGKVVLVSDTFVDGQRTSSPSYGNYVIIEHTGGYRTIYAHLKHNSIQVAKDAQVSRGQAIAKSGDTGYVTGAHLHLEVQLNGTPVDPYSTSNPLWTTSPPSSPSVGSLGDIGGLVKTESGTAVADATVTVAANGQPYSTKTDAGGRYMFFSIPAVTVSINATKTGVGNGSISATVAANTSTAARDIILTAACMARVPAISGSGPYVAAVTACPTPAATPVPSGDPAAPDTTILSGPAGCGNSKSVTVSFTGSDNQTPVSALVYAVQLDGAAWSTFSSNTSVTFSSLADGNHTIRVKAKDQSGLEDSSPASVSFQVDAAPPISSLTLAGTQGNHGWHRSDVTVTITASDGTGCGNERIQIEYNVDGAGWTAYNGPITLSEGKHTVEYRAKDAANNTESTRTMQVNIDKTIPVTNGVVEAPRDMNGVFRDAVKNTLTCTDNLSGEDYTEYSLDAGQTWNKLGTDDTFLITGNGISRYAFRCMDMAGNGEQSRDSGLIIINKYVIFGNSTGTLPCAARITMGTTINITGDIHSNGCVDITYNTGCKISGVITSVGTSNKTSANTNCVMPTIKSGATAVPMLPYSLAYYKSVATAVYPDGYTVDSVNTGISGIIYVTGTLNLNAVKLNGPVVFIAERDIRDVSVNGAFQSADTVNGAVMVAGGNIQLNSTGSAAFGLVYAPKGKITINSTNFKQNGSLIANQVDINGATTFDLKYDAAFAPGTYNLPLTTMGFTPAR